MRSRHWILFANILLNGEWCLKPKKIFLLWIHSPPFSTDAVDEQYEFFYEIQNIYYKQLTLSHIDFKHYYCNVILHSLMVKCRIKNVDIWLYDMGDINAKDTLGKNLFQDIFIISLVYSNPNQVWLPCLNHRQTR